jgi:arylsulfatase A-like enzyme
MDHDEAAHESGPFSPEAIATLEYTDELVGQVLAAAPANTVVAIVSDHGFEAAPRELNIPAFLASKRLPLNSTLTQAGYVTTFEEQTAAAFTAARTADSCIGREIPRAEVDRFMPRTSSAARLFEPAPGCVFTQRKASEPLMVNKPTGNGHHGHWPTRYRASFVVAGPGIKAERLPELDMRDAVKHFAKVLKLTWPPRP